MLKSRKPCSNTGTQPNSAKQIMKKVRKTAGNPGNPGNPGKN